MALFVNFQNDDIIQEQGIKVTEGFFTGGVGTIGSEALTTASLSTTQKNYYYNLQYSSADNLSVTYGHIGGSGSDNVTNVVGETEAVYKHYANLVLNPINNGLGDSIDEGFQITSGTLEKDMYFISFERARMKDRINRKTWTLDLSGSKSAGTVGTHLYLTDNSEYSAPKGTVVGPRYDVVSGSAGVKVGSTVYGYFYPYVGLIALAQSKVSASLPGMPGFIDSGSTFRGDGIGLAPELNNDGTADNAWKIARCVLKGSHTFRNEEDQAITSYFCRAKANNFNFSANPTFISGSLGEFENKSFAGNPQTFITTVGLYDAADNLVAIGKLSKPIKKNFSSEAVVKVQLTY